LPPLETQTLNSSSKIKTEKIDKSRMIGNAIAAEFMKYMYEVDEELFGTKKAVEKKKKVATKKTTVKKKSISKKTLPTTID
jgi:hypothetical protein